MSEMQALEERPVGIPPLTRGWRMQMAMEWAGLSRDDMAHALGVAPTTITRWTHDQGVRQPRRPDMEVWARVCRVPIEWLAPSSDEEMPEQPTVPNLHAYLGDASGEEDEAPVNPRVLYLVTPD